MKFRRNKAKPSTPVLEVRHRDRTDSRGTLTVARGHTPQRHDRLQIISVSKGPNPDLRVFINGRSHAATLVLEEGDFKVNDVLLVESVT